MSEKFAVKSQQLVRAFGRQEQRAMDTGKGKREMGKRTRAREDGATRKGQGTKCCPAVGDGDTGSINSQARVGHFVVGCGIECGL